MPAHTADCRTWTCSALAPAVVVVAFAVVAFATVGDEQDRSTAEDADLAIAVQRLDVEAARAAGDVGGEAVAWRRLGELLSDAGDLGQTVEVLERALELHRDLAGAADPAELAETLDLLAEAYRGTGADYARSLELLEEALELRRQLGDPVRLVASRNSYCLTQQKLGRFRAAAGCYESTLAQARSLGDPQLEARLLNNLGGIYSNLGEPAQQAEFLESAVKLHRALGDDFAVAASLNNLGSFHRGLGEIDEAVRAFREALAIFERLDQRYWLARTLNNLGYAYLDVGELERARAYLLQAIPIRREVGDKAGEAVTLRNLGRTFEALGDPGKAFAFFQKALELADARGDQRGVVTARKLLGRHLLHSEPVRARRELEQALVAAREMGHRHEQAELLELLSRAHLAAGQSKSAEATASAALDLHRQVRDPLGEVAALSQLARTARTEGRDQAALGHLESALGALETVDRRLGEASRRASFLASQRSVYELLVDLLMARHRAEPGGGHEARALEVSEQARSRALLALLDSPDAAPSVPRQLAERLQVAERRLAAKIQRQVEALDGEHSAQLARELEAERLAALGAVEKVRAEIRRIDPRDPSSASLPTLDATGIRALLDDDTVLLEFLLGEERGHVWWVSAREVTAYELPPREPIEALARRVHEQLQVPGDTSARHSLSELGRLLLGPVVQRLREQRLVVVADGALHLVPFSALGDPRTPAAGYEPLLLRHELVELPSASVLAEQRARSAPAARPQRTLAMLADTIFSADDPRAGGTAQEVRNVVHGADAVARVGLGALDELARLPHTRAEAEAIASLVPASQRWVALDAEAGRSRVVQGELNGFRIVHFATHGILHPQVPELSGLVLSRFDGAGRAVDGFLGLHDVAGLDLSAELVVLSGCHSALGKALRGEGLVGLARGFMYARVPRVVASRWQVRDQATAELMELFYRGLLVDGLPAAAALRAAQLRLRVQRRYRHPYHWAAFALQGDWS